jgi:hypothetical protein
MSQFKKYMSVINESDSQNKAEDGESENWKKNFEKALNSYYNYGDFTRKSANRFEKFKDFFELNQEAIQKIKDTQDPKIKGIDLRVAYDHNKINKDLIKTTKNFKITDELIKELCDSRTDLLNKSFMSSGYFKEKIKEETDRINTEYKEKINNLKIEQEKKINNLKEPETMEDFLDSLY